MWTDFYTVVNIAIFDFDHGQSPYILYERLPVWQETYGFGVRDPAAVLYPAYNADHKPAGPNGIRRESHHLLIVLEGLDMCQVFFPAVRPVPPSYIYQPAQPLSCSYSLLLF